MSEPVSSFKLIVVPVREKGTEFARRFEKVDGIDLALAGPVDDVTVFDNIGEIFQDQGGRLGKPFYPCGCENMGADALR